MVLPPRGRGRQGLPIPLLLQEVRVILEEGGGSSIEIVDRLCPRRPVLLQILHQPKAHRHRSVLQLHELVFGNDRISPLFHLSRPM